MISRFKRGQEEIVGFVLIIVLVAIALLVLLGFALRDNSTTTTQSTDIYQFLESSMEIGINCTISTPQDYATLREGIRACYEGRNCLNGGNSCSLVEKELQQLLTASWPVQEGGRVGGYQWESAFTTNTTRNVILNVTSGTCEGSSRGSSYPLPASGGRIENNMIVCFNAF